MSHCLHNWAQSVAVYCFNSKHGTQIIHLYCSTIKQNPKPGSWVLGHSSPCEPRLFVCFYYSNYKCSMDQIRVYLQEPTRVNRMELNPRINSVMMVRIRIPEGFGLNSLAYHSYHHQAYHLCDYHEETTIFDSVVSMFKERSS